MIKMPTNWKDIKEAGGDFPRLTPGGYVAIIRKVTDFDKDQYMEIEYDIAEGNCKGIAASAYERFGSWNYKFRVYYREKSLGFFKHFISEVEKTNNFTFDFGNVNCLVNKGIGIVVGTRQYWGKDGTLKEAPDVQDWCTAQEIRENLLPCTPRVKEPRNPAPQIENTQSVNFDDGELPF